MSYAIPLPARPRLDYYKKLAKELLRASSVTPSGESVRAWAARWLEASGWFSSRLAPAHSGFDGERSPIAERARWVEQRWVDLRKKKAGARAALADAQFFLAREHGFPTWPQFAEQLRAQENAQSPVTHFEAAADAIVRGDEQALAALLRSDASLVKARSLRDHRSTLLHYCSANGVEDYRQRTPANIVAIARLLLDADAEVNAESDAYGGGSTTLMLTATSGHPERAGVQIPLLELLLERGAGLDIGNSSDVVVCLRNGRGVAAEFLARHGARLDLEGAPGVGLLDRVKAFFTEDGGLVPGATAQQLADGFGWACEFGRFNVVEFLLEHGLRADTTSRADRVTPLHWAALGGHPEIVKILLARGADVNARETRFDGTPVGWALHGWGHRADGDDGERYYAVVDALVAAGAQIGSLVSNDQRMTAALLGESSR
ncbi:MAG TPA: ankyrin repeat domain-containing protein [Acidobacteriaceae bacterium]